MLYGIYRIDQILKCSDFDFTDKHGMDPEWIECLSMNDILTDYTDMFRMLAEIKEIIDKMMQEDENKNIGKLMADQEGEHNEL